MIAAAAHRRFGGASSTLPSERDAIRRRLHGAAGVLLVAGMLLPACTATPPWVVADCTRDEEDGHSVARVWDEQLLALIRQVVPAPTVHARNLFHVSAAMWDAWAAYDPTADGYFVTEKLEADDATAAREAAMSFAAYRILLWRYSEIGDLDVAPAQLEETMASLCFRPDFTDAEGGEPAALGNRIAATVIAFGAEDGALEQERYVDASYTPANDPLEVDMPGTEMRGAKPLAASLDRGADLAERDPDPRQHPELHRTALGPRGGLRARAQRGRPADRSRTGADAGRPGQRRGLQGRGDRHDLRLERARSGRWRGDRRQPGRDGEQPARDQRRIGVRGEPGDRRAVRAERRAARRLRQGPDRVLGRWADVGDAAGPLERRGQRGVGLGGVRAPHRGRWPRAGPARVGREDVLCPQRGGPRRGDRRLGREARVRVGSPDLDGALHGRPRPVERSRRSVLPSRRAAARGRSRRGDHRGLERAG